MNATGIMRRIDDLGRVVIPKEIRRTMRIREGDPLEIYTNKDELVFKKYSPIANVLDNATTVGEVLSKETDKVCFITDNDKVKFASHSKYKELVDLQLTDKFIKVIHEKKSLMLNKVDSGDIIELVGGKEQDFENQIIVPIIVEGESFGSVVLVDNDKSFRFSSNDVKLVNLTANLLAKNL